MRSMYPQNCHHDKRTLLTFQVVGGETPGPTRVIARTVKVWFAGIHKRCPNATDQLTLWSFEYLSRNHASEHLACLKNLWNDIRTLLPLSIWHMEPGFLLWIDLLCKRRLTSSSLAFHCKHTLLEFTCPGWELSICLHCTTLLIKSLLFKFCFPSLISL